VPGEVTVEGHTDTDRPGPNLRFENNTHLSRARAQSVVEALTRLGVDGRRMKVAAFGSSRLLDAANGKSSRNRRVEIVHVP
jgi:flagellar motor protein MotB